MRNLWEYKKRAAQPIYGDDVVAVRKATAELTWREEVVIVQRNADVTTVDINLGTPVGYSGRKILIKNGETDVDNITIAAPIVTNDDGTSYQSTIDGATTVVIAKAWGSVEIMSDGSNFHILRKDLS